MNPDKVKAVWSEFNRFMAKRQALEIADEFQKKITDFFCPGESYYYVFDFGALSFMFMSSSFEKITGLDSKSIDFESFINNIHPEDLDFFSKCENTAAKFLFEFIAPEDILNYKVNYCFRVRRADGSYSLFSHQSTALTLDDNGRLSTVLGVHTDISHFVKDNNHKISFIGIDGKPSYTNLDVFDDHENDFKQGKIALSKREKEVLYWIAEGYTTSQIADRLYISEATVRKHREHLLTKTNSKNTAHLIANCYKMSLV